MVRVWGRSMPGGGVPLGGEWLDFGKAVSVSLPLRELRDAEASWLLDETHDLDGAEREEAEHDVAGDLVGAADADHAAGEVVLEVGDDALGGAALLIAVVLGGAQGDPLLAFDLGLEDLLARGAAGVGLDQGDMAQRAAVGLTGRGGVP